MSEKLPTNGTDQPEENLPQGIININGLHCRDVIEGPIQVVSPEDLEEARQAIAGEAEERRWFSLMGSRLSELEQLVEEQRASGEDLDYIIEQVEQVSIPHAGIADEIVEITVAGTGDWHSIHAALYPPDNTELDQ